MSRIILVGTAEKLHILRKGDLPDLDLKQSYWQYVDFSGFDLSTYDMRDMDIYDSNGDGAILPTRSFGRLSAVEWLVSRNTSWRLAKLPTNLSRRTFTQHGQYDFVQEILEKQIDAQPSSLLAGLRDYIRDNKYTTACFGEALKKLEEQGLNATQLDSAAESTWVGFAVLQGFAKDANVSVERKGQEPRTTVTMTWPDGVSMVLDNENLPLVSRPYDRYALARWFEEQAGPPKLKGSENWGRHCWVISISPYPKVKLLSEPDGWLKGWD